MSHVVTMHGTIANPMTGLGIAIVGGFLMAFLTRNKK